MSNYAATYNTESLNNVESFFSNYVDDEKIVTIKKDMRKLSKELEDKSIELSVLMNKRYNSKLTECEKDPCIVYNRDNNVYFDPFTGVNTEPDADSYKYYNVSHKNGTLYLLVGYAYEMASVVVRLYKYYINTGNTKIRMVQQYEAIIPVFAPQKAKLFKGDGEPQMMSEYEARDVMASIKADEFIKNFYGIEDFTCDFSLRNLCDYTFMNKSTEIILRTVTDPKTRSMLLCLNSDNAVPVHTLCNMTKPEYKKALEDNTLVEYLELRKLLTDNVAKGQEYLDAVQKLGYSTTDWLDFINHAKAWKDDLDFYGIGHDDNLAVQLLGAYLGVGTYPFYYAGNNLFCKYYKFGKFANYVIEECVNQGYTRVHNFMTDLLDYIKLCRELDCKPTLFSSYLKQTHDIVARNHKLKVSQEQEEMFKLRYEDIKNLALDGGFSIIKPKSPSDLQKEGDSLNHCVASYIKRVLDDACRIMFLRKTATPNDSLVTLEVAGGAIVQARGMHNRSITDEERKALNEYAAKRHLKVKV